jgi:hypothetical protein
MLLYACVGIAPLGELKRIASTNRILKAVFAPILLLPVSDHPNRRVRLGNTRRKKYWPGFRLKDMKPFIR